MPPLTSRPQRAGTLWPHSAQSPAVGFGVGGASFSSLYVIPTGPAGDDLAAKLSSWQDPPR